MASRAKSVFIIILLLLLVGGGVAAYFLTANLNGIVADLIETQGSEATQTNVQVSGVDIRLTDASAALAGLTVANPEGFEGNALELGGFSVTLDPATLTDDTIVIREINVDGARLNVLQQGTSNNLRALLDNLPAGSSTGDESAESGKKIIIERFSLNDVSASVSIPDLNQDRELTLPPLVVTDIGKASNGATGAEVARQLLSPLLNAAITSATAGAVKDRIGSEVKDAVGGFLKGLGKKKDED